MSVYYKEGKVTITHGSHTVSGDGTAWITAGIPTGSIFIVDRENDLYIVSGVSSETILTLTTEYEGTSISIAETYSIVEDFKVGQYNTGYVNIEHGSIYVSGSETDWLSAGDVQHDSIFMLKGDKGIYYIDSVDSNTMITLQAPYYDKRNSNVFNQKYVIMRDYTKNYGFPMIINGDVNWPTMLTKAIREIDEQLYAREVALLRVYPVGYPSGTFVEVSGGEFYYQPNEAIEASADKITMYYDPYYHAFLFHNGTMASAAPSGAEEGYIPVWYPVWYKLEGTPI